MTTRAERRGVNPEPELTGTEKTVERITQAASVSENWLFRHSSVIATFLVGIIAGYVIGAW